MGRVNPTRLQIHVDASKIKEAKISVGYSPNEYRFFLKTYKGRNYLGLVRRRIQANKFEVEEARRSHLRNRSHGIKLTRDNFSDPRLSNTITVKRKRILESDGTQKKHVNTAYLDSSVARLSGTVAIVLEIDFARLQNV